MPYAQSVKESSTLAISTDRSVKESSILALSTDKSVYMDKKSFVVKSSRSLLKQPLLAKVSSVKALLAMTSVQKKEEKPLSKFVVKFGAAFNIP